MGGASGGLPSITAELIAQCFLNLPNNINASSLTPPTDIDGVTGDNAESVVMATDAAVSAANVLAALGGTLTEGKFFNSSNSLFQIFQYFRFEHSS